MRLVDCYHIINFSSGGGGEGNYSCIINDKLRSSVMIDCIMIYFMPIDVSYEYIISRVSKERFDSCVLKCAALFFFFSKGSV